MDFKIYKASEAELIKGCLRGNREAQKRLYDHFSHIMYPVCCRYVRDEAEAEDVLVIAFTKVYAKISQFRNEGSFEGWIKRIVIHEALNHLRHKRTMLVVTDIQYLDQQLNISISYDHLQEEDLLNMIMQLPPGYRTVFNMYAIDGYSHKEIAAKLGISENTSKSQLSRARVFLQKLLLKNESLPNNKHHGQAT